jgi:hypothetical protein
MDTNSTKIWIYCGSRPACRLLAGKAGQAGNNFLQAISTNGQAMVLLLLYVIIAILITTASVATISINSRATDKLYQGTTALNIAESGAETAMIKLLRDPNYSGETLPIGTGQAVITVTGTTQKTVVSVGTIGTYSRKLQANVDYTNNILTVTSWREIQ